MSQEPPANPNAEAALLGAVLLDPDQLGVVLDLVGAADFTRPDHARVWSAIVGVTAAGGAVDRATVTESLRVTGDLDRVGGERFVLRLQAQTPAPANAVAYAEIVARLAQWRRVIGWAAEVHHTAHDAESDEGATLARMLAGAEGLLSGATGGVDDSIEWSDLAALPEPVPKPWVIPGLLRAGEVFVLTGSPGGGKMTVLRMFAVGAAAGLHPFTEQPMARHRVLIVDLQEDATEFRAEMRPLLAHVGGHYHGGNGRVVNRRQGIDLLRPHDARWFEHLVASHQPTLVVMGPLKKCYQAPPGKGIWDDDVVEALHRKFDAWQTRYGFALCMEGHAGHAGQNNDDWHVKGSSVWRDWPHFGRGLSVLNWTPGCREAELCHFRGDREGGVPRAWPRKLTQAPGFPWAADDATVERLRSMPMVDPFEQPELEA